MAEWHLDALRNGLERNGWTIVAELAGNDYDISASWEIRRSTSEPNIIIDFQGLDDLNTLPIEESYACLARGRSREGLYFGRRGTRDSGQRSKWQEELKRFIAVLNDN